jgi:hypothetical protein
VMSTWNSGNTPIPGVPIAGFSTYVRMYVIREELGCRDRLVVANRVRRLRLRHGAPLRPSAGFVIRVFAVLLDLLSGVLATGSDPERDTTSPERQHEIFTLTSGESGASGHRDEPVGEHSRSRETLLQGGQGQAVGLHSLLLVSDAGRC